MNSLSNQDLKELFDALHFMNMKELRQWCNTHNIPSKKIKSHSLKKLCIL